MSKCFCFGKCVTLDRDASADSMNTASNQDLYCFPLIKPGLDTLTHCILNRLSHTIYWKSPISVLGMSGCEVYFLRKKAKLFANSGDPDQTPRSAASDLGLHCLPITLLRVSQLQWVKR